jgi:hypothetical protein
MIWQLLEGQDVTPKYFVCGCPKHGLHLAAALVQGYVRPMPPNIYNDNHWIGTFRFNSFAPVWQEMERWFFVVSRLQQGHYYQGHVGWRQDVADFLRLSRVAFVFIYRDLRDVAVSMAHHIMSNDNKKSHHPAKGAYHALGGFDEVLAACITGLGEFPGVVGLWELYAGWLNEEWTHCIKYEDAVADLEASAEGIVEYGLGQITRGIWESRCPVERSIFDRKVKQMATLAGRTDLSPTFRKGLPGEWQESFTEAHKDLFKKHDPDNWLKRLGYVKGDDW